MAQIPRLPVTMIASVRSGSITVSRNYNNQSSAYDGFPYEFDCILDIIPLSTSELPDYEFTANDIEVGMWILQQSGLAFEITSVTVNTTVEAQVTLRDTNLYNLLSDYTFSGNNYPQEILIHEVLHLLWAEAEEEEIEKKSITKPFTFGKDDNIPQSVITVLISAGLM